MFYFIKKSLLCTRLSIRKGSFNHKMRLVIVFYCGLLVTHTLLDSKHELSYLEFHTRPACVRHSSNFKVVNANVKLLVFMSTNFTVTNVWP